MEKNEIRAYLSESERMEGKETMGCIAFHEDLGILDPATFCLVAARGLYLKVGDPVVLSHEEQEFLEWSLPTHPVVAVQWREQILVFLQGAASNTGLLPVVLHHGSGEEIARWLHELELEDATVCCSPRVAQMAAARDFRSDAVARLRGSMELCKSVFFPSSGTDFRAHCANVSRLAGCRGDVTQLPTGEYPIEGHSLKAWTMFLLCVLLTVRGDSALGAGLSLSYADRADFYLRLVHQSEYHSKGAVPLEPLYAFAKLPVFSDYRLIQTPNGLVVEAALHRAHTTEMLSAGASDWMEEIFALEIFAPPI